MISILAATLVLGIQTANKSAPYSPEWAKLPTHARVSTEWMSVRQKAIAEIKQLAGMEKGARLRQIQRVQDDLRIQMSSRSGKVDPILVYRGAILAHRFSQESKSPQSVIEYACDRLPGSQDPEFRRAVYIYWCLNWSPGCWPGLGSKLMEIFPNDITLQEAFTRDAHLGSRKTESELDLAEKIFDRNNGFGKKGARALAFKASIWEQKYDLSKRKSALERAIGYYAEFLKLEGHLRTTNTEVMKVLHKSLTKKLAEGKYRPG